MKLISHQYKAMKVSSKEEAEKTVKILYSFVEFMGGRVQAIEVTSKEEFQGAEPGDFVITIDIEMATPSGRRALWKLEQSQGELR